MRILFDQGVPRGLASPLVAHTVEFCSDHGWSKLANGELLSAAQGAGFQIFLTTDKNLRYQQNLAERQIAVIVLGNARWPVLVQHTERVVAAVERARPSSFEEVEIPLS